MSRTKRFALVVAIAIAGRADISQTATFSDGLYLSLDKGQTTRPPGAGEVYDIQWTNGAIVPVAKAKVVNVGVRTSSQFGLITESDVKNRLAVGGSTSTPASNLVTGDVFYTIVNIGNASKIFVGRAGSGVLIVDFLTYQSAPPGAPKITAVLNNSSRIVDGLPNSGIAPSSLFVVQGTGMADPGDPVLQSSAAPGLPLTLNGTSITVVVLGVTAHPALYYTSPTQLAAVLPANPAGWGVTNLIYFPLSATGLDIATGLGYIGSVMSTSFAAAE